MQTNPVKAIREKCIDCCCGDRNEVKLCTVETCSLHPFRFGKNPYRSKRIYTDEQREAMALHLSKIRNNVAGSAENTEEFEDDCEDEE